MVIFWQQASGIQLVCCHIDRWDFNCCPWVSNLVTSVHSFRDDGASRHWQILQSFGIIAYDSASLEFVLVHLVTNGEAGSWKSREVPLFADHKATVLQSL